eukprot:m.1953 g.1953  ORF g.1953 m.1953 type:complete len:76 (+) comp1675_c0_seq1:56-283(+)
MSFATIYIYSCSFAQSLNVLSHDEDTIWFASGLTSTAMTFPSCPWRTFRGEHSGLVHTFTVLSYELVTKKLPEGW